MRELASRLGRVEGQQRGLVWLVDPIARPRGPFAPGRNEVVGETLHGLNRLGRRTEVPRSFVRRPILEQPPCEQQVTLHGLEDVLPGSRARGVADHEWPALGYRA